MIDKSKKSFTVNILRRGCYKWRGRWMAEKRSKLERNTYFCENPECGVIGGKKEFQMDHKIPCVPVTGWDSLDGFADRLYCDEDGLWRLCKQCHHVKTQEENRQRGEPEKRFKKRAKNKKRA